MEQVVSLPKTRKKRRKSPRVQQLPALHRLRAWLRLDPATGHLFWLKPLGRGRVTSERADYLTERGYYSVTLYFAGKSHTYRAHRIVWALHNNALPDPAWHIDHEDRNRGNNKPSNLIHCTPLDNMQNRDLTKCRKQAA